MKIRVLLNIRPLNVIPNVKLSNLVQKLLRKLAIAEPARQMLTEAQSG